VSNGWEGYEKHDEGGNEKRDTPIAQVEHVGILHGIGIWVMRLALAILGNAAARTNDRL
jgi:hypothetical protein